MGFAWMSGGGVDLATFSAVTSDVKCDSGCLGQ